MSLAIAITYANKRNSFIEEWEQSARNLDIPYVVLGLGEEWIDFSSKIKAYHKFLQTLDSNDIVVIVDGYDVLFLEGMESILEKYKKLCQQNQILVGAERFCVSHCCYKEVKQCSNNERVFPNSGCMIGQVYRLLPVLNYIKNYKDDQYALGEYMSNHCSDFVLDYNSEVILNYLPLDIDKIEFTGNKLYNTTKQNYPSIIQIPGQNIYYHRSETVRNWMFPNRKQISVLTYFDNALKKIKFNIYFLIIIVFIICYIFRKYIIYIIAISPMMYYIILSIVRYILTNYDV